MNYNSISSLELSFIHVRYDFGAASEGLNVLNWECQKPFLFLCIGVTGTGSVQF